MHPMTLGMTKLMELADERKSILAHKHRQPSPSEFDEDPLLSNDNSLQTKRRFQSAINGWVSDKNPLTATSLRKLAKRCLELADEIEQEQITADNVSGSTSSNPPSNDKPSQVESRAGDLKPGTKTNQETS